MLTSVEVERAESGGRPSTTLTAGGSGVGSGLQHVQMYVIFSQRILYQGTSFSFFVFSSLVPEQSVYLLKDMQFNSVQFRYMLLIFSVGKHR